MKVYLAGPITGQTYGGSTGWRDEVKTILENRGIRAYSPMRGKAYLSAEEKMADTYTDKTMSSINGINVRDYNDVKTSDAVLVNLLPSGNRVSIGTVMEIAWARMAQIPVVIVMNEDNVHNHGMLIYGNIVVPTIEQGVEAVSQILLP